MANKDDLGKGPSRPGDIPGGRRPYATIDAKATEVDNKGGQGATASASASARSETGSQSKPSPSQAKTGGQLGPRLAAILAASRQRAGSFPFLTHLAAGAAGGLLVLILIELLAPIPSARAPELGELARRVVDLESGLGTRPGVGLRARVDEMSRSVGMLGETQARLARETKALEAKIGNAQDLPPELVNRLSKLEETLAALSTASQSGQPPQVAALTARLADIEKTAREAGEAVRAGGARLDGDFAAVRTEAGRLAQRIDGLRGEVDERLKGTAKAAEVAPIAAKLALLERDLLTIVKGEADRTANTSRVVLGLELASLKRAVDRGESYAAELAQVKRIAGDLLNLAALDRSMLEGVPTTQELAKSFRKVANAMLDAEAEPADAGVVDRLLAGARSIVRVRKAALPADDTSAEAVIGRMEAALKEGRLGEVLAQAKKLPPKAELAGEDWVKKVAARHGVDQALADVEAALKTSLGTGPAGAGDVKR